MSIHTSRTADTLPGAGKGAAMGTWGLWLGLIVLAMFVAGLGAAALYLHTGHDTWPPTGIERPGMGHAVVATVLAVAGSVLMSIALRYMGAASRRYAAVAMAASMALLVASVVAMIADIQGLAFRWDLHAYTSVYWVLTGGSATFIGAAVLMTGAVLIQTMVGLIDERRHLEMTNAVFYSWFATLTTMGLLSLVHLLPFMRGS